MNESQDREGDETGAERFFSVKQSERKDSAKSGPSIAGISDGSEDDEHRSCLTLRILQYLLPCLRNKGVWEPSQGDVFKSHDAEEAKYPRTLRILESRIFDVIFVASCLLSIYLFLFSEGFLLESRLLWGIIHLVNAVYALGLFSQWLQILIKSKYAKTNHGYTTKDIVYTLVSVFPADLIVLVIYTLNDEDDNEDNEATNPIEHWMITVSRLNYFLRIRSILQYFSKWKNHMVIGDFSLFLIRTSLFTFFLLHMFACIWHRLACRSFRLKHFLMTPDEATTDVCTEESWIGALQLNPDSPLLHHPDWHVLVTHYLASFYWSTLALFRLGAGAIQTTLSKNPEVMVVILVEIGGWIYIMVNISGTLASLLIVNDTEKERFLTRCFAIRLYLKFTEVARGVQDEVYRFYAYLWVKSRGIVDVDLIDYMPHAMKSEVFYDVNKFVMDQMPMLKGLETAFLMNLSLHTKHHSYLSGEVLFRKNDTAECMYYLVKGHLDVLDDKEVHTITTIRSGSILGEVHLLQPYPQIVTVRCGSNCDLMVLSRRDFRKVLASFPQCVPALEQRLENRLEQSGLLLALCEKHNTYQKAFKVLREAVSEQQEDTKLSGDQGQGGTGTGGFGGSLSFQVPPGGISFENVKNILAGGSLGDGPPVRTSSEEQDFDGLELNQDMEAQLVHHSVPEHRARRHNFDEILAAACLALETDVARAGSLATDLNIPRPPIIVACPENMVSVVGFGGRQPQGDARERNFLVHWYKKASFSGGTNFLWDAVVAISVLAVFWYYPYQFSFRGKGGQPVDYGFHLTDVVFWADFLFKMVLVVVTPQRTFEQFKEIMAYHLKTVSFYVRLFAIIPFEYIFAVPIGIPAPYFYIFKFNRLLLIHLLFPFLINLETRYDLITPIKMALFKLLLGIFFVCHLCTVGYKFVLRDVVNPDIPDNSSYLSLFYRSAVVVTSLGYGDISSATTSELVVEVTGLLVGVATIIFLQCKVTAVLVNSERRRVSFQQVYYALQDFMSQRKFPKELKHRVCSYYDLQWQAHEGTLIPREERVLWDAPQSIISKVAVSVGQQYLGRVPLFKMTPDFLQTEFCLVLNHYMIPPGEVLLYPEERRRDLYIVTKGFVEVVYREKIVGRFGEGRYFGLNGLLYGVNTNFLFRTVTFCNVLCLTFENFVKAAKTNHNFMQEFELLTETGVERKRSKDKKKKKSRASIKTGNSDEEAEVMAYPAPDFLLELWDTAPTYEEESVVISEGPRRSPVLHSVSKFFPKKKHLFQSPPGFYFRPNGTPLKVWFTFRLLCAVAATIFAPVQVTFPIHPMTSFGITYLLDVASWLDIVVSLRTAYLGEQNQLVTSTMRMAWHYLKGNFVLDILACFPADLIVFFGLVGEDNYGDKYYLISLLRLNRMLQGANLFMIKSILGKTMFKSLSFLILLEMVPLMVLFVNLTTCFAILPVCRISTTGDPAPCDTDGWIISGLQNLHYIHNISTLHDTSNEDVFASYLVGVYWVLQTIFSLGFGDLVTKEPEKNQVITIVVIGVGVLTVSYVVGRLTACMQGEQQEKMDLQEKSNLMGEYLETHRVTTNSRRRVNEVYNNFWDKTRGIAPDILFQALPPTMRTSVMNQLYAPALKNSPLFENLDPPGIRMLTGCLTEIFYSEGEYLMKFGDLCDDMFFVANGAVICYNVRGDIMSQLGAGSLIGEPAPEFHNHRLYTAIAVKDVTAYVFGMEDFRRFMEQYPEIKSVVEQASHRHFNEASAGTAKRVGSWEFDSLLYLGGTGGGSMAKEKEKDDLSARGSGATDVCVLKDLTRKSLPKDAIHSPEEFGKVGADRWWHVFVTFGHKSRDEMGLVHIHQELEKCTLLNFVIHPASSVCQWVTFCLIITALSCGITAFEVAFSHKYSPGHTEGLFLKTLRYLCEVFFLLRIIGNFHLGYYDETITLITSVHKISRAYVFKLDGLWIDFITTFPFYLAENYIPGVRGEYIRSLQLLRVILFVRYLHETDNSLTQKATRGKLIKTTVVLCFIFHFWACAWYLIACTETCVTGSWMQEVLNNFPGNVTDDEVPTSSRYMLSLYYVVNSLTYTGFPEIIPKTRVELMMTIMMVFVTMFIVGYLVGEMVQCLASQMAMKIDYQHKLAVLENHFLTLGISSPKIEEMRHYFKLLWCRSRGLRFFSLMEELPYTLRADVAMEIYGPNMKSSRILGRLDENLIRQLCARIRHEIYFPGSHIVRAGDVCTSMYFIKKGEVVILDGNSNLELCVEILYENECFGEVKILLVREQYRFSYVARLETEVGVLRKEDLDDVLRHHPRIFEEMKEKANRVKIRRQSLKEDEDKERGGLMKAASSMSIKSAVSQ